MGSEFNPTNPDTIFLWNDLKVLETELIALDQNVKNLILEYRQPNEPRHAILTGSLKNVYQYKLYELLLQKVPTMKARVLFTKDLLNTMVDTLPYDDFTRLAGHMEYLSERFSEIEKDQYQGISYVQPVWTVKPEYTHNPSSHKPDYRYSHVKHLHDELAAFEYHMKQDQEEISYHVNLLRLSAYDRVALEPSMNAHVDGSDEEHCTQEEIVSGLPQRNEALRVIEKAIRDLDRKADNISDEEILQLERRVAFTKSCFQDLRKQSEILWL